MAKRESMTWRPGRRPGQSGRWSVWYAVEGDPAQKKHHYIPAPEGKTASKQRCWRDWLKTKAGIDATNARLRDGEASRAWQPIVDALRRAQQQVIDTYGDTDKTREVWRHLENHTGTNHTGTKPHGDMARTGCKQFTVPKTLPRPRSGLLALVLTDQGSKRTAQA